MHIAKVAKWLVDAGKQARVHPAGSALTLLSLEWRTVASGSVADM